MDEIIEKAREVVKDIIVLEKGDKIIVTGGFPIKKSRGTNFIKIEEI